MSGWRAAYSRWQPYGTLVLLCAVSLAAPHASFFILALLHWTALDALRTRRSTSDVLPWADQLGLALNVQFRKIDDGHRFAGDHMKITSDATYSVGAKRYAVRVERESVSAEA